MKNYKDLSLNLFIVTLAIGLSMLSCKKEDFLEPNFSDPEAKILEAKCEIFDSIVSELPGFSNPTPSTPTTLSTREGENGDFLCTFSEVQWGAEYNEHFIIQPFTEVIYPGALIDGNSIIDGSYRPIISDRDSLTISISHIANSGAMQSAIVSDPSQLSVVRESITDLLYQTVPNATAAFVNFEIESVRSEEEARLKLGAHFKGWGAKVNASYEWSNLAVKSRYLVKFSQLYYSVDVDLPSSPCDFFSPIPTAEETNHLLAGSNPVYVSSVKYGRMVYFMVESSRSAEQVKKALEVSFSRWGIGGGTTISRENRETLENSTIRALIIGGSADGAVKTISGDPIEGLKQLILQDAQYSLNSPGVPLSYTLRFLADNAIAKVVLSSKYTVQNCELKGIEKKFHPRNGNPFRFCADNTEGDGEFGGNGPFVDGKISLKIKEGNEVWANIHFTWTEVSGDTQGEVKEEFHLFTTEPNQVIIGFTTDPDVYSTYTDVNHSLDYPEFSGGNFIEKLIVQGDTRGNDLGCDGNADAFIEVFFKPITIMVREQ